MSKNFGTVLILLFVLSDLTGATFDIKIDAQKDSFYTKLSGPVDGMIQLTHHSFLPFSGAKPDSDQDLSATVWFSWDSTYLYVYAEITDDLIRVNNYARPQNDCLELKFDPDPSQKQTTGIVNARLTALDSSDSVNLNGVDNLYSEGYLDSVSIRRHDYARRLTEDGYAVETRLAWEWLQTDTKKITAAVGVKFGLGFNIHDNDSEDRDGSIQWAVGRADEIWTMPQLLGTARLGPGHKLELITENSIDPTAKPATTYFSAGHMQKYNNRMLPIENWRYHPGDDTRYAETDFDDSQWELTSGTLSPFSQPESGWQDIGWFRTEVKADTSIVAVPLSLVLNHSGASELYVDGKLWEQFGKVSADADSEKIYWERNPGIFSFKKPGRHVLALRYSNTHSAKIMERKGNAGFFMQFSNNPDGLIDNRVQFVREFSIFQIAFVSIQAILAILHLLLFAFNRQNKGNLYFGLCMISWMVITFTDFQGPFYTDQGNIYIFSIVGTLAIMPASLFALLTIYATSHKKLPKQFWIFLAGELIITLWITFFRYDSMPLGIAIYLMIGLIGFEILRIMIYYGFIKRQVGRLILIGFGVFMIAVMYQLLSNMQLLPRVGEYGIAYVYGFLILSITVSLDLSLSFARTNRVLEQRLREIQDLSEKTIRQERLMHEESLRRKMLEADNARKTKELEDARDLQLSMLPKEIPAPANLDIAARMLTANEVGGDYYDFYLGDDNTLTIAVGDATGHGLRAGTMVASVKSLFAAFGSQPDMRAFFNRCTGIIKEMHMGNIFMGLMLVRFNTSKMWAAAAGMPPLFIYRCKTGHVEEMVMKGMPLGAFRDFTYQQKQTHISPGDTILLMTDGFTELFNNKKEMMEYPQIKKRFAEVAEKPSDQIINDLVDLGEKWRQGVPPTDDCTFVVIKVKEPVSKNSQAV